MVYFIAGHCSPGRAQDEQDSDTTGAERIARRNRNTATVPIPATPTTVMASAVEATTALRLGVAWGHLADADCLTKVVFDELKVFLQ